MNALMPTRALTALFLALTLTPSVCAADVAPVRQGAPPPNIPPPEASDLAAPLDRPRTNWAVIAPGLALVAAGWILNVAASLPAGLCTDVFRVLSVASAGGTGPGCRAGPAWDTFRLVGIIPLVGPFAQLALKPGSLQDDAWATWLVADGLAQVAGVVLLAAGISTSVSHDHPSVALTPRVGPRGAGLSLSGRF